MFVLRWMRSVTRAFLGFLTIVPVVALVLTVLLDRGPAGEVRVSFFPMALRALDPFVWTCARNSLIFAVAVTATALAAGIILGWLLGRLRSWGRPVLRASTALLLAASPVVLALGLVGTWGMPHPWPWPFSAPGAADEGLSLETWRGVPLWVFWIWSTLPGAVAIVVLSIAAAVEWIEPEWEDAARLAGAGRFRTWRRLIWPLIRPAGARAAALVFPLALVEPGAPLILGLRRTLAFQIVEAARRPDPFPRIAVWSVMAGLIALAGRLLLRRWGGPPILDRLATGKAAGRGRPLARKAGIPIRLASLLTLAAAAVLGWLPVLGLFRLVLDRRPDVAASGDLATGPFAKLIRSVLEPPMPRLAANSVLLGLEIATGIVVLAWVVRPAPRGRPSRTIGSDLVRRLGMMPPLLQGVGILALPWLAGVVSSSLRTIPRFEGPAERLADLARELSPERNPWALLAMAVGLTVGLRFLRSWQWAAESESDGLRSGLDAAALTGASPVRARAVTSWRPARWIGRFLLVACFAATGLTPALLFTPWMDGRTIAPAIVILVDGPDGARLQAAALALTALAANLTALIAARLTSAWPRDGETERF
jgi:ABC-type Fe3+ transport system permease subunit